MTIKSYFLITLLSLSSAWATAPKTSRGILAYRAAKHFGEEPRTTVSFVKRDGNAINVRRMHDGKILGPSMELGSNGILETTLAHGVIGHHGPSQVGHPVGTRVRFEKSGGMGYNVVRENDGSLVSGIMHIGADSLEEVQP